MKSVFHVSDAVVDIYNLDNLACAVREAVLLLLQMVVFLEESKPAIFFLITITKRERKKE